MSTGETTATAAGEKPFKLLQARDANGRTVSAREIGMNPEPFTRPLRCPYCEHPVTSQRAHPKTSKNGKPFTVSAHFSLARHKDGRPAEHDQGCALRTDHTITTIATQSQGFAEVKRGQLQLRLVLAPSTDPPAPAAPVPGTPVLEPPEEPVNRRIRSVGPKLPPVITSAARIAQLLALYEHDPELMARFTVQHQGLRTPVPWNDFCFGPGLQSLTRLYHLLATPVGRQYPVAVHGQVLEHGISGDYAWCRIAQDVPTGEAAGPRGRATVLLRSQHHELLTPLTRGMHALGLGAPDSGWGRWTPQGGSPTIRLFVKAHWQLSYWSVDDSGLPSTPKSPPPVVASAPPRVSPAAVSAPQPKAPDPTGTPVPLADIPELRGISIPPMPTYKPGI